MATRERTKEVRAKWQKKFARQKKFVRNGKRSSRETKEVRPKGQKKFVRRLSN